jgi:membrane associated rhomboid family serine protease
MATCYRHPDRETGVSCSSCGRPICPECMTPTPVGMRCPECMRQRTKVVQGVGGGGGQFGKYPVTMALIAINVAIYLVEVAKGSGGLNGVVNSQLYFEFSLYGGGGGEFLELIAGGGGVAGGQWYRLVSGGFLHASITHILFNMVALYFLGRLLEPALGSARFTGLYFASLLAGSFGALILDPTTFTVGASGAIFGIAAATFVIARGRGLDAIAGQLGILIALNLLFSFSVAGISIGGHLGGLVGGGICAAAIVAGERGVFGRNHRAAEFAAMALVAVVSVLGALAVA